MVYLYALLNLIVVIVVKGEYDKSKFDKGIYISHPLEWGLMGIFSTPAIYLLGHQVFKWYGYLNGMAICMAVIWLLFDMYLNKRRKKPLLYAGVITNKSGWWDRQLNKIAPNWRLIIKLTVLGITIGVYVLTLLHGK